MDETLNDPAETQKVLAHPGVLLPFRPISNDVFSHYPAIPIAPPVPTRPRVDAPPLVALQLPPAHPSLPPHHAGSARRFLGAGNQLPFATAATG
uniref:Uncharacterized protein n=1 Tax=Oryza barthii TaxID=65489 RepID=A0A0D3HVB7_9ORYZ